MICIYLHIYIHIIFLNIAVTPASVYKIKYIMLGVPWWPSGWDSGLPLPQPGFNPWSGKFPQATRPKKKKKKRLKKYGGFPGGAGASLVAQWLGVCLLVRGTQVRALAWEDPACRGAVGPVSHSC